MKRTLKDYEPVVGANVIYQLKQLAREVSGAKMVHVNSTRMGGGVAEILNWLVPLSRDLGLDASWEIVEGQKEYYQVTKAFHNGLQGDNVPLTQGMLDTYEETVARNAERLRPILEEADFVFIHDPQPAALLDMCGNRKGKWMWRCHIFH